MKIISCTIVLALFGTVACDGNVEPPIEEASYEIQLKALSGCEDVEVAVRDSAIKQMEKLLKERLSEALLNGGLRCDYDVAMPNTAGGGPKQASGGANETSSTNNQVAGVDEADFVKNDNQYLYVLSKKNFRIVDAWPAESAHEIAKVGIEGEAKKLFIQGDIAMVYSSLNDQTTPGPNDPYGNYYGSASECTYGYNCSFTGDGFPTKVTIFDISDKTAPVLKRELKLSGSLIAARRIGSAVYSVVSSPSTLFKGLSYWPRGLGYCDTDASPLEIMFAFDNLRQVNLDIINSAKLTDWFPALSDTQYQDEVPQTTSGLLADCKGFYKSTLADGNQFTTLIALDLQKSDPVQSSTIVSAPGAVYSSAEALYLSVPHSYHQGWGWYDMMKDTTEASTVHKFKLDASNASAQYTASGIVKGRVLNQFAMDEKDGYLRMATTTGRVPQPNVHSTMTIFGQQGTSLAVVGQLDGLAPSEDIRSVRFDNERGYVVTFKKTDPLFVFDLSNPGNPQVLAELKIPGFSTYMHMMDDNHLLTIGYDANDQGSFAWFTGVMLQIFDVSDPFNPLLAHKEVIGTRGSSSEALTNHLAFNYFAPKGLLALPMTVCEGGAGGGAYGNEMTFSGLMVYNASVQNGFSLQGKVEHPASEQASCNNWWTNASSEVKRSVIMDDYVYSISESLIKVNKLQTLSTDLGALSLAD